MLCPYKFGSAGMVHVQKIAATETKKRRDIFKANPDTCGCELEDCAVYDEKTKTCSFKK